MCGLARKGCTMTRSQIRRNIFTILFRVDFTEISEFDEQITFAIEEISQEQKLSEKDRGYIETKVSAIVEKLDEIDAMISSEAQGWKLPRIGKAELTILRLAVYEMKYEEEIPVRVAINEAVELAKVYCDEDAKGFVNAVLGNIERAM